MVFFHKRKIDLQINSKYRSIDWKETRLVKLLPYKLITGHEFYRAYL